MYESFIEYVCKTHQCDKPVYDGMRVCRCYEPAADTSVQSQSKAAALVTGNQRLAGL